LTREELSILIAGVGGQGNLLASEVIASAAVRQGLKVRVAEIFGAAQRGGAVVSHIRIGPHVHSPLIGEHEADVILGFEPVECLRTARFISPESTLLMNSRPVIPVSVNLGLAKYPDYTKAVNMLRRLTRKIVIIDATALAEKAGHSMLMNMVMVGALAGSNLTPIATQHFANALAAAVPKHTQAMNLKAYEYDVAAVQEAAKTI